ncbi:AraC family transcriptional regulator [Streptomyces tricolor]|nr:AraC family transcriptional regulator [Streptomyces tricolor]
MTEICTLVGFSSLGTFSARFKARTGLTPSAYRTRRRPRRRPHTRLLRHALGRRLQLRNIEEARRAQPCLR